MSDSRNPTTEEVVDATIQGISTAQRDYKEAWESHIFNSAYSPEYFTTVYIFQSLFRLKKKCGCSYGLSVEQPVRTIIDHLPRTRGRYPRKLRPSGKCDLVLWEEKEEEKPLVAIEVKEDVKNYHTDIERLASLVQRNLKLGVFASCQVQPVEDKRKDAEVELIRRTNSICKGIKQDLNTVDKNLYLTWKLGNIKALQLEGDEQKLVWCPICLLICHKKDR